MGIPPRYETNSGKTARRAMFFSPKTHRRPALWLPSKLTQASISTIVPSLQCITSGFPSCLASSKNEAFLKVGKSGNIRLDTLFQEAHMAHGEYTSLVLLHKDRAFMLACDLGLTRRVFSVLLVHSKRYLRRVSWCTGVFRMATCSAFLSP